VLKRSGRSLDSWSTQNYPRIAYIDLFGSNQLTDRSFGLLLRWFVDILDLVGSPAEDFPHAEQGLTELGVVLEHAAFGPVRLSLPRHLPLAQNPFQAVQLDKRECDLLVFVFEQVQIRLRRGWHIHYSAPHFARFSRWKSVLALPVA